MTLSVSIGTLAMVWFLRGRARYKDTTLTGWEGYLYAIGRALDGQSEPLRDIAISTTGDHAFISGLARHSSLYQSGWTSVTYRVEEPVGDDTATRAPRQEQMHGPAGRTWALWLRAVGLLIDRSQEEAHDVCVLEVDGGAVVGTLSPRRVANDQVRGLANREFTTDEIKAAMAEPVAGEHVSPVALRAVKGPK